VETYNKALIPRAREMRQNLTRAEARLWFGFLRDFEPRVRRQRPFGSYIVDFYCAKRKTVVEVDGESHFTDAGVAYDAERTVFLEALGLKIVRFTNAQVFENFEGVCEALRVVLG
jgi:very-short-patch-repair endonuclease